MMTFYFGQPNSVTMVMITFQFGNNIPNRATSSQFLLVRHPLTYFSVNLRGGGVTLYFDMIRVTMGISTLL